MMDFARARRNMVDSQVRPSDVTDRRLIQAMLEIPREEFVPAGRRPLAYIDEDLPISSPSGDAPGRWLMEPMQFARLVQLAGLGPHDLVLDVGCGTGYSTAVMARLVDSVVGLESDGELSARADAALADLGVGNAAVVTGPLELGYPSQAPYDAIVLEGMVEEVPGALMEQLREGGRLVAPMRHGPIAKATLFQRVDGNVSSRVAFDLAVPALPGFSRPPAFVF